MKNSFYSGVLALATASFAFGQGVLSGPGYIDVRTPSSGYALGTNVTGPRFVWSPDQRALWFGESSAEWGTLPFYSFAGGPNAFAGTYSFAWLGRTQPWTTDAVVMGRFAKAEFNGSIALGFGSLVNGPFGIAIGVDEAMFNDPYFNTEFRTLAGAYSLAVGSSSKAQDWSTTIGAYGYAINYSTAIGAGAAATDVSLAMGGGSASNGSVALGGGVAIDNSVSLNGAAMQGSFAALGGTAIDGGIAIGPVNVRNGVALGRANINLRRDGSLIGTAANPLDPVFEIGNGTLEDVVYHGEEGDFTTQEWLPRNALTIYRDQVARFGGPVQIKAGAAYVTLEPSGTVSRTILLPDADGTLLTSTSPLNAALMTGTVPAVSITSVAWSKVSATPTSVAGYGITDAVKVDAQGYALAGGPSAGGVLRVRQAGDIPMYGQTP